MTRRGLGFLIVTTCVYLVANQTRIGWLFLGTAFMLGVAVISIVLPRLWTAGIRGSRTVGAAGGGDLHEDAEAEVTLRLRKDGVAGYLLLVREVCPFAPPSDQEHIHFLARLPSRGASVTYRAVCHRRGRYTLPPASVESDGLFGLFRIRRALDAPRDVTVYPWYLPDHEWRAPHSAPAPPVSGQRPGSSPHLLGVREYRSGDSFRHIHWRSSARRDTLIVKEFEEELDLGLAVLVDVREDGGRARDTVLENAIRLAASLARYASFAGRPFRIVAWPPARGASSWRGFMEYLTDLHVDPDAPALESLAGRLGPGEQAVIAGANSLSVAGAAEFHRRRGGRPLPVLFAGFGSEPERPPRGAVVWRPGADPAVMVRLVLDGVEAAR